MRKEQIKSNQKHKQPKNKQIEEDQDKQPFEMNLNPPLFRVCGFLFHAS